MPTLATGMSAGLSILFFLGLANHYGDTMLGEIILVQTAVALVQIALIPNCMVFLLGSSAGVKVEARYSESLVLEWLGTAAAFAVIAAAQAQLGAVADGATAILVSLSTQASAATMGIARLRTRWRRYAFWVLAPNLIRMPLVWLLPVFGPQLGVPDLAGDRAAIIIVYFMLPDLVRLLVLYVPEALASFRWPTLVATRQAARQIYRNWFFDIGSAATDQTDKLVVGALFGPAVLVAYFFARRIGVATVMVTEPFYLELFRRRSTGAPAPGWVGIWRRGAGFALAIWATLAIALATIAVLPIAAEILPEAVVTMLPMFLVVMLLDSLLAANRWSRFLAEVTGRAMQLLALRIVAFAGFAGVAWLTAPVWPVWGIVAAMAAALLVDGLYVRALAGWAEKADHLRSLQLADTNVD